MAVMSEKVDKIPIENTAGGGKANEGEDFSKAIAETIILEKPDVKWSDVAGLEEAKASLNEALVMPIKFPNFFTGKTTPWRGILLYGPPGTGKTFLAKAAAGECNSTFFSVSSSDLISKYMGESEKMIKELFNLARQKAPSIIFIDEIDSMCGTRAEGENESSRRVKTEFLVRMQGLTGDKEQVLVLGATNTPWGIDNAVLRRFERRIYIDLPDFEARKVCLKNKMKELDKNISEEDYNYIAKHTEKYTGSDLEVLVKDALMEPVRFAQNTQYFEKIKIGKDIKYRPVTEDFPGEKVKCTLFELPDDSLHIDDITIEEFKRSLAKSKSSVNENDLLRFREWEKTGNQH